MEPIAVKRRQATTGFPQVIGGLSLYLCRAMVEHFEACGPIGLTHRGRLGRESFETYFRGPRHGVLASNLAELDVLNQAHRH